VKLAHAVLVQFRLELLQRHRWRFIHGAGSITDDNSQQLALIGIPEAAPKREQKIHRTHATKKPALARAGRRGPKTLLFVNAHGINSTGTGRNIALSSGIVTENVIELIRRVPQVGTLS
jgi:hypothetical protein